jgi:hypothetical protein
MSGRLINLRIMIILITFMYIWLRI